MRVFHFYGLLYFIAVLALGCAPEYQVSERLTEIESEIREIEDSAEADPNAEDDLDRRIDEYQQMISELKIEASTQSQTYADEMRILEFQGNQTSELLRSRIEVITARIQSLERNLMDKRPLVFGLIPPPEMSDSAALRAEVLQNQEEITFLEGQKSALLSELYTVPEQYSGELNRTLASIRSRQSDLAFMIEGAKLDLENLKTEKKNLLAAREEREKKITQLREERKKLAFDSTEPE